MDRRAHHMTDPSPNRLSRKEACAIDKSPRPMHTGKTRAAVAPPPSIERLPDNPKDPKR